MAKDRRPQRLQGNSHPLVYEINCRVLLTELSRSEGKPVTLGTIPESLLDGWAESDFDAIWCMGVWTTGEIGKQIALAYPDLQDEYRKALPDFTPADVAGSPYAIQEYEVSPTLGGPKTLAKFRRKLADRGMGLILDFVPNHTALDHAWVRQHPEFFVQGTEEMLASDSGSWFKTDTKVGKRVLAHGRDPMFPAWTDTVQVNHLYRSARAAMIETLCLIAEQCDGVRADMAMLVLREVFLRQWGEQALPDEAQRAAGEFWSEAINAAREINPNFLFIAEVYWDLEWSLQQLGFNYTYDKRLYERMRHEGAGGVRDHLRAEIAYQSHSLRFIENHDEPRAATAFSSEPWHFASALIMATVPGMALFHDGQMEGRTRKLPVQLSRRADEPPSERTRNFYASLLRCLSNSGIGKGTWKMLDINPGWHDNPSWENYLAFCWDEVAKGKFIVVVNYAPHSGQCYVRIPLDQVEGATLEFRDLMSEAVFVRDRVGLIAKGLYIDLPGYGFHVFAVTTAHRGV